MLMTDGVCKKLMFLHFYYTELQTNNIKHSFMQMTVQEYKILLFT